MQNDGATPLALSDGCQDDLYKSPPRSARCRTQNQHFCKGCLRPSQIHAHMPASLSTPIVYIKNPGAHVRMLLYAHQAPSPNPPCGASQKEAADERDTSCLSADLLGNLGRAFLQIKVQSRASSQAPLPFHLACVNQSCKPRRLRVECKRNTRRLILRYSTHHIKRTSLNDSSRWDAAALLDLDGRLPRHFNASTPRWKPPQVTFDPPSQAIFLPGTVP